MFSSEIKLFFYFSKTITEDVKISVPSVCIFLNQFPAYLDLSEWELEEEIETVGDIINNENPAENLQNDALTSRDQDGLDVNEENDVDQETMLVFFIHFN